MARPSNTEERRAQIVGGLMSAMAERGYEGASIPDIARAAGLSPGLVHYHFENKQEILLVLVERLAQALRERFERRARGASSPRARLYAFLDAHVALGDDANPRAVACWVTIGAEAVRQKEVRTAYRRATRRALEELEQLVAEVLRDERRSPEGGEQMAAALMAAIYGCYQLASAAQAAPRGFAAPMLRRMADGLLSTQAEVRTC
jgi:TetR/AcrR family transcriptional regulator, transcriptional repressor of bet genes